MTYKIQYTLDGAFPKLGWIALVDTHKKTIDIMHGRYVECHGEWAVEGVWDGKFKNGNFHRTEAFFGSGIRKDLDKVYFVTSCTLADRIVYCHIDQQLILSNSLLLMLGFTNAELDQTHDYQNEARSVPDNGIEAYDRSFKVVHPKIEQFQQVFYENIVLKDDTIQFEFKPRKRLKLTTFDAYYSLLLDTVKRIKNNYASSQRNIPVKPFSTVSSGYDCTAVSALVKNIGVKECFTGNPINGILSKSKDENGREIAERLGFVVHEMDTKRSSISEDELYFLATNYPKHSKSVWSEISLHSMVKIIEDLKQTAIVFTGYRGDHIWDINFKKEYQETFLKGGGSLNGTSLMEVRLKAGFCTIGIPYLYSHYTKDIAGISKSLEMRDWKINTDYDRPIPRRIAEEAGLDRNMFGMNKRHINTSYIWPLNKTNRSAYYRYLKRNMNIGKLYVLAYYLQKRIFVSMFGMKMFFGKEIDFYDLMKKWATHVLAKRYAIFLAKHKRLLQK